MGKYKETFRPFSSHEIISSWVRRGSTVLDVGCGTGYLAACLEANGCEVTGIDRDPAHVQRAHSRGVRAEMVDLASYTSLTSFLDDSMFDYVICADVLEHLNDPQMTLRTLASHVGRSLVVSLPNVAHWSMRWNLLRGRWCYQESGILDRTHLQFFTQQTAIDLVAKTGYQIVRKECAPHPMIVPRGAFEKAWLHRANHEFACLRPSLLAMQFLFEAVPQ